MSSAGDRLRLKRQMRDAFERREAVRIVYRAVLGDGVGNVQVTGKKSHVYVRRSGRGMVREVLNVNVPARNNLPVLCGYDSANPRKMQVLAVDWGAIQEPGDYPYLPQHHETHELFNPDGGDDVVWVQKTQIIPLMPFPTNPVSMQLWVQKDFYPWGSGWNYWPGGLTADLSAYIPHAYNGVYVLVSIDGATNALQYTAGSEFPSWPPPAEGDEIPTPATGSIPICAVYLHAGHNLLTNDAGFTTSGFETAGGGGADIWAYWTEFVGAGALADDAVTFYEGAHSCQTTEGGGRDTGVYQDITVTAGDRYQLRFWNCGDDGANDGAYRVYDVTNGADIIATTGTGNSTSAWVEVTALFTAPAGCATVRVYFYCPAAGANQAWFDAATVAEVPASLSWDDFRDVRLFNSPMPGSVAAMPDAWTGIGAAGGIAWQPDNCARLRAGVVTEYADPDDAFTNANQADDVVLVPPGTWTLSNAHTLAADVSVKGIGGPPSACVLQGAVCGVLLILSAGDGEIADLTIINSTSCLGTVIGLQLGAGARAWRVVSKTTNTNGGGAGGTIGIALTDATAIDCRGYAYYSGTGATGAIGIDVKNASILEHSYGYGYAWLAGGISYGIRISGGAWCWAQCVGEGAGLIGTTRYGIGIISGINTVENSYADGQTDDLYVAAAATLEVYSLKYDSVAGAGTITQLGGDRTGQDIDETITGTWTFDEELVLKKQPADPGVAAGYTKLYAKSSGLPATTKMFYVEDDATIASGVRQVLGLLEDITISVPGDFATIQDAIDQLLAYQLTGDNVIEVAAGAYDEHVDFSGLIISPGSTLTLEGDTTRELAGMSFIDGMTHNRLGPANGGSGVCGLANAGANITVTGTVANPDFDADGWGSGDRILVKDNAGAFAIYTIDSTLNNVITLTVAAPNVGNNGTAIALIPDRSIEPSTAGVCVQCSSVKGICLVGWYLESHTGANCNGFQVDFGGLGKYRNVLVYAEDWGLYAVGAGSQISFMDYTKPSSVWCSDISGYGIIATETAYIGCTAISLVGPGWPGVNYGIYTQHQGVCWAVYADIAGWQYGAYAHWQSEYFAHTSQAQFNDYGYVSKANSMAVCTNTMALVNNITADYTPNPGGAGQYAEDNAPAATATYGVLYKS